MRLLIPLVCVLLTVTARNLPHKRHIARAPNVAADEQAIRQLRDQDLQEWEEEQRVRRQLNSPELSREERHRITQEHWDKLGPKALQVRPRGGCRGRRPVQPPPNVPVSYRSPCSKRRLTTTPPPQPPPEPLVSLRRPCQPRGMSPHDVQARQEEQRLREEEAARHRAEYEIRLRAHQEAMARWEEENQRRLRMRDEVVPEEDDRVREDESARAEEEARRRETEERRNREYQEALARWEEENQRRQQQQRPEVDSEAEEERNREYKEALARWEEENQRRQQQAYQQPDVNPDEQRVRDDEEMRRKEFNEQRRREYDDARARWEEENARRQQAENFESERRRAPCPALRQEILEGRSYENIFIFAHKAGCSEAETRRALEMARHRRTQIASTQSFSYPVLFYSRTRGWVKVHNEEERDRFEEQEAELDFQRLRAQYEFVEAIESERTLAARDRVRDYEIERRRPPTSEEGPSWKLNGGNQPSQPRIEEREEEAKDDKTFAVIDKDNMQAVVYSDGEVAKESAEEEEVDAAVLEQDTDGFEREEPKEEEQEEKQDEAAAEEAKEEEKQEEEEKAVQDAVDSIVSEVADEMDKEEEEEKKEEAVVEEEKEEEKREEEEKVEEEGDKPAEPEQVVEEEEQPKEEQAEEEKPEIAVEDAAEPVEDKGEAVEVEEADPNAGEHMGDRIVVGEAEEKKAEGTEEEEKKEEEVVEEETKEDEVKAEVEEEKEPEPEQQKEPETINAISAPWQKMLEKGKSEGSKAAGEVTVEKNAEENAESAVKPKSAGRALPVDDDEGFFF